MTSPAQQHRVVVDDLQTRAAAWQTRFHTPLGLGVKKKVRTKSFALRILIDRLPHPTSRLRAPTHPLQHQLAIVTCMDSRVHPERIFDLAIGDAEVRNE